MALDRPEHDRLRALATYLHLAGSEYPAFDRITDLASRLFQVPVSTMSLVDDARIVFLSHYGVEVAETGREGTPQDFVIRARELTVISDASRDSRFARPPTLGGMRIRFYSGAPLITTGGHCIGVMSIIDTRPRPAPTSDETEMLADLAALAMDELNLQVELLRAKATAKALRQSEERSRLLMESASQGIVGVNRAGEIVLVNQKAEELFGYTRAEMLDQPIEMLVPGDVRNRHVSERESYFHHPKARPMGIGMDLRGQRKDGVTFPVEISLNHLELDGDPMAISFITDITERTRLEQQLRQSQKMEAIGQLAGGVAHDFNNLLTVISGYAQLVLDGVEASSPFHEPLAEISAAALKASSLTQQLLAFSRKQVVQPAVFSLNERVSGAHRMLARLIGEHIRLELALEERLPPILADPGQIDQVIMNLVVNARDAMPAGGRLLIETAALEVDESYVATHLAVKAGPHVMLAITDTGTGMTPEVQSRLFEPFFTTKGAGHGTGLGLATVYGIVKQAGGSIFVYSELGQGTTFKVLFPVAAGSATEQTAPLLPPPRASGEIVLVVEDEEAVRKFITAVLTNGGYTVIEALNGEDALAQVEQADLKFDLVLTDVVMPKVSGPDLVNRLRDKRPSLRAIYMSGYTDRTVPLDDATNVDFIQKPFTATQLQHKVKSAIRSGVESSGSGHA